MAIPIWKDTFFEVPASASPYAYSIEVGGETIFNGKAWAAPFEDTIKVGVNRVAQDYLSVHFPNVSAVTYVGSNESQPLWVRTFTVRDAEMNTVNTYDFYMDWSYKEAGLVITSLDNPINDHRTRGQYYFRNIVTPSFGGGIASCATRTLKEAYGNGYCADGVLYYLNRRGGWESFLIEGNILRRDEYTRYSITKSYDNNTLDRGKMVYNNAITPTWELHTAFLNGDESKNLAFNLLSSNQVYFHDLVEGKIYPVVITDASGEYKTVKNQGNKLVTYTISISASQTQHNLG